MRHSLLTASLLVGLAAPALSQEPPTSQPPKKERAAVGVPTLIEQLGHKDFELRQVAEERLLKRGGAAKGALEQAAKEHKDPEVRWRSRRILRKLDGQAAGGGLNERDSRKAAPKVRRELDPRRSERFGTGEDLQKSFDRMFRRMEREFGLDIPRHRFFDNDFFKDLDRQMDRVRKEMDRFGDFGSGQFGRSSKSGLKMSVGPDGVRVEVEEKGKDGKSQKKVYQAEDMESFKRKYPDVVTKFGIGNRFGRNWVWMRPGLRGGLFGGRAFTEEQQRQLDEARKRMDEALRRQHPGLFPPQPQRPAPQQKDFDDGPKLGVYIAEVPAVVRDFLSIEKGQGLLVEEIVPGSLAERLDLRKSDILLSINKQKIGSAADIRSALDAAKPGSTLVVQVNRRGKTQGLGINLPASRPAKKKLTPRRKIR